MRRLPDLLNDFPERILARDLSVDELEEVGPAHLYSLIGNRSAR